MTDFLNLERDTSDLALLTNANQLVTTRYGGVKESWLYFTDRLESDFETLLDEVSKSRGFVVVGSFSSGFIYSQANQVGSYDDGVNPITHWIWSDASAFDDGGTITVAAGTIPSSPDYTQVTFNDHNATVNRNVPDAHDGNGISITNTKLLNSIKKSLQSRIENATEIDFAAEYLTEQELIDIDIDYATGEINKKPTVDITQRLIECIDSAGGSSDITSAFLYEPAKIIKLPAGAMGLQLNALDRILISKNNIIIVGAGMFNTRICHIGSGHANEMIRFKEAYACGLMHLTLDGGLPWRPDGTEAYGVDIPLVLDQVAHFYCDGLNVCNYRHRGFQFIHFWESYIGEIRAFNGGWFPIVGSDPGGMFFDDFRQESTAFPGSESNQININKYAFSGLGAVYHFTSPCFNIRIGQVVSEDMTYSGYFPAQATNTTKCLVSGISSCVVVEQAWYYFHDQVPAWGPGATLFDLFNAGQGCSFNDQVVFQEIPITSPGNVLGCPAIFSNSSAYPVRVDISIEDNNSTTEVFATLNTPSLLTGTVTYRTDQARTFDDFFGETTGFEGTISFLSGPFTADPPTHYQIVGTGVRKSSINAGGLYDEIPMRCRASVNGTAGTVNGIVGLTFTKVGTGVYQFDIDNPFPDSAYSVACGIGDSIPPSTWGYSAKSNSSFTITVRNPSGTAVDTTTLDLVVSR